MIELPAFAKVNLGLELLGARPDGYTEIRTIFQTIDLADTLRIDAAPSGAIEVVCDDPSLPAGEENLAGRALRRLVEALGWRGPGVRVEIVKRIPAGGGLGGGSSDAAAALVGACRLWGIAPGALLVDIARSVGSDVPYFLWGGTALGLGRGEEIWPLPDAGPWDLVLAVPPFAILTSEAYAAARAVLTPRQGTHTIWRFALRGLGVEPDFSWAVNELQPVVARLQARAGGGHRLDALLEALQRAGALAALMTGSGSAVFGLFPPGGAGPARETLQARYPEVRTIPARTMDGPAYRRALGLGAGSPCWGVDKR